MAALFFYVAAQTGINSFFINYVTENASISNSEASLLLSFGGMGLFMLGRIGRWQLGYVAHKGRDRFACLRCWSGCSDVHSPYRRRHAWRSGILPLLSLREHHVSHNIRSCSQRTRTSHKTGFVISYNVYCGWSRSPAADGHDSRRAQHVSGFRHSFGMLYCDSRLCFPTACCRKA